MKKAEQPKFIQREDGSWYYERQLDLKDKDVSSIIWPDNLEIKGGLWLSGSNIKKLPDNLRIAGYLDLEGCKEITHLPNKVNSATLDLIDTNIKEIGKDIKINKTLYLSSISDIKFEEGFYCKGLYMEDNLNPLDKRVFNRLIKFLINREIEIFYYSDYNIEDFRFNLDINYKIRRNLIFSGLQFYFFFNFNSKTRLIKELYKIINT